MRLPGENLRQLGDLARRLRAGRPGETGRAESDTTAARRMTRSKTGHVYCNSAEEDSMKDGGGNDGPTAAPNRAMEKCKA